MFRAILLLIVTLSLCDYVYGFVKPLTPRLYSPDSPFTRNLGPTRLNVIDRLKPSESSTDIVPVDISLREYMTPQYVDKNAVLWILAGQGLVLNIGVILSVLGGFDPRDVSFFSFDSNSMMMASFYAAILIAFGQILDRLPFSACKSIALDTRVFALRVLGRSTSIPGAALTSALISFSAGFSEELVFRGILFSYINLFFGPIPAYVTSSVLFGLAHSPVFGANVVLESLFGAFFAYAFVQSGYNIAVPIALHSLYDFFTIFVTWWFAAEDLRNKLFHIREGRLIHLDNEDTKTYNALTKAVFETIDIKGQGYIDPYELELGMRLFGFGPHPFGKQLEGSAELFHQLDVDKDGKLSLEEFSALMQQGLYRWPDNFKTNGLPTMNQK